MGFGLLKLLNIYTVFLFMNREMPPDGSDEGHWARLNLASAIVETSDSADDWALLARISRWESFYRPDVFDCRKRSKVGASGPFQVIPRSKAEGILICTDWIESGKAALMRVQESRTICKALPKAEQLAQYTTGKCEKLGKMMSRMRYATAKDLYFPAP